MVDERFYNVDDFSKFARLCEINKVSSQTIKRKLPTAVITLVDRLSMLGFSHRYLSTKVGLHRSIFGYWKRGQRKPSIESYMRLYDFYEREVLKGRGQVKPFKQGERNER